MSSGKEDKVMAQGDLVEVRSQDQGEIDFGIKVCGSGDGGSRSINKKRVEEADGRGNPKNRDEIKERNTNEHTKVHYRRWLRCGRSWLDIPIV